MTGSATKQSSLCPAWLDCFAALAMTGYKQSSHCSDPALTPLSIVLVLSAAFLHASWNALLRGGADRTQSMLIMNVTVGIAGLAMMAIAGLPAAASAAYVFSPGLIRLGYNAQLGRVD